MRTFFLCSDTAGQLLALADGSLVLRHAAFGLIDDGLDDIHRVFTPEVGADLFGKAFGSVEDTTANDDLGLAASADLVERVDQISDIGEIGRGRGEEQ